MLPVYHFALVGDPIEHSLSPLIHETAFEMTGLEGDYVAIRGGIADLEGLIRRLVSADLNGLNVTMPLKRVAMERSQALTPEAQGSGSVNALRIRTGILEGHSTDVVAFRQIYQGMKPTGPLLVLGAGGAAGAALAAWPGSVAHVSTRHPGRAGGPSPTGVDVVPIPWGEEVPGALVVNATPLGMAGESLPERVLEAAEGMVDLPYGSGMTPASRWMAARGKPVADGIEFLVRQAAAAFEWWTGVAVDSTGLESVARNA
jgi:shikimate dehydrogenase